MTLDAQREAHDRIVAMEKDRERQILLVGGIIVTMDRQGVIEGDLLIRADRIESVGPGLAAQEPDAIIVDASGTIIIPGLIDSHVHAWEAQLRGVAPDAEHGTYIAITHGGLAQHYLPEDIAIAERLTAAQAINAGTTTIVDNSHNGRTREHSDAALEALLRTGIRAVYAAGGGQAGEHDHQFPRDLLRLRDEHHVDGSGLVTLRMYAERPVIESLRFADEHGFDVCLEMGRWIPEVEELASSGLMRPGHTYNHCVGLSADVWRAIADSGAAINLVPRSDSQFGLAPFAPVLEANRHGLQEGISTDNEVAYAHDLFTEMRTLMTVQRGLSFAEEFAGVEDVPSRYGASDVLRAATVGGALNAGGSSEIGTIAPGKRADLVLLSLDALVTRPWGSVIGTVVNYAGAGAVDTVFIDGRIRKWGGTLVGVDVDALVDAAERSRGRLLEAFGVSMGQVRRGLTGTVDIARADDEMRAYLARPGH